MFDTLGIIEFGSIAKGIEVADKMIKGNVVEVLKLRHICPGKFMIIISGDVESVKESVEKAIRSNDKIVQSAVISNVHPFLITYLKRPFKKCKIEAAGVFETYDVASALISLDSALKSSPVSLVKLVIANGIGGKSYFVITGCVSSVKEAIKVSSNSIEQKKIVYKTIISHPDEDLAKNL